jgi:hypothetical protein
LRVARTATAAFLLVIVCGPTLVRADADIWSDFRFLLGDWVGEGEGQPGRGLGGFSLVPDLQGKVLVRRSQSVYPAASGRPASTHDDLMVIFRQDGGTPVRASYFDSEGHVILYSVSVTPDKQSLIFISDNPPSMPQFRLTYAKGKSETVSIKFEIAPPGKLGEFKTYLDGNVRRKAQGEPK